MTVMGHQLEFVITREDGMVVARCVDVEVVSDGDSEEDAVCNLKEALTLYFEDP